MEHSKNTLIQINQYGMGHGDPSLAIKLMGSYLKLILDDDRLPKIITFYNAGVKLLHKDSPVLETLKLIEAQGVVLLACKTCLDFYEMSDLMAVGIPGTMMDIITLQANASKVITL
ncbi:DsrE family protein [Halosquirtibacter xylanolyticus]|uniref:DsrE family protein n=1 Tax=Halosquirtibacter xylanolyticus TaxID=3374599 RepID=UPI0037490230|nr:DsrE family protein [Prolixibacteraceae bacterium]